jgi:hypothetical protein
LEDSPEVRRRVIGWFMRQGFLDSHAAADGRISRIRYVLPRRKAGNAHAAEGCSVAHDKPRSHDTSRRNRRS